MRQLSPRGRRIVGDLALRFGLSDEAVTTLLYSLGEGRGNMAQFDHPELGGMGQWTRGGMIMIGDMFNNALKAKIDGVCSELSVLLATEPLLMPLTSDRSRRQSQSQGGCTAASGETRSFVFARAGSPDPWWPAELGAPTSTGAQNDIRYAYFPATRRLATDVRGHITIYDTQDHHIAGVSQQQSGDASLTFIGQRGLVSLANLPIVSSGTAAASTEPAATPAQSSAMSASTAASQAAPSDEIISTIERLADLRAKGILSEEEFAAKKADLLTRL